jgi:hypothetical protein
MGRSSLLGFEHAVIERAGWYTAALGPGDNSDSGSDRMGLDDMDIDDPVERHSPRRGVYAGGGRSKDIGVDRVFEPGRSPDDADPANSLQDDEDPDIAFIDGAVAEGPPEDEDHDEDGEGRGQGDEGDNIPGGHATTRPMPKNLPKPF